ncbi:MAG: hypothetical protein NC203_03525 [Firmicutes bacterium]|nr:hypothetical protein [Bacillota bacterium]
MNFKFKLWLGFMKKIISKGIIPYLILMSAGYAFYFLRITTGRYTFDLFTVCALPVGLGIWFLLVYIIGACQYVYKNGDYTQIYEEKGYCREMKEAFEQRIIVGKNPNNFYRLYQAEIYMRIGEPENALSLLAQMRIPPEEDVNFALCTMLYIRTYLLMGNTQAARYVWDSNYLFIQSFINSKKKRNRQFINVLCWCLPAIEASEGDYDAANAAIDRYCNPNSVASGEMVDFATLRVYIYNQTGNKEYEEKAVSYANALIQKTKFESERLRITAWQDLEKARNGIIPI